MKFLVVLPECGFSSSSSSIFAKNFLKFLANNHHVDVIGFRLPNNYSYGISQEGTNIARWITLESKRVIQKAPKKEHLLSKNKSGKNNKFVNFLKSFIPDFYMLGLLDISNFDYLKVDDDYDFIISMSDPKSAHFISTYLRVRIAKLRKAKVVQIWGDPWYFDITRPTNLITKFVENLLLNKADYIFYRSRATVSKQKEFFPKVKSRINMFHRGFIGDELSDINFKVKKEFFNFLYLGDYNPHVREIEQFCRVANDYGHEVKLIGNTTDRLKMKLKDLPNIQQIDRLSPSELQPHIDGADCLVAVLNKKGTQMPGKVYDLIPVKKPVLLLLDGEFTRDDTPAAAKFEIVNNDSEALIEFFENLEYLNCSIQKGFNVYHMKNVVKDFIKQLSET